MEALRTTLKSVAPRILRDRSWATTLPGLTIQLEALQRDANRLQIHLDTRPGLHSSEAECWYKAAVRDVMRRLAEALEEGMSLRWRLDECAEAGDIAKLAVSPLVGGDADACNRRKDRSLSPYTGTTERDPHLSGYVAELRANAAQLRARLVEKEGQLLRLSEELRVEKLGREVAEMHAERQAATLDVLQSSRVALLRHAALSKRLPRAALPHVLG